MSQPADVAGLVVPAAVAMVFLKAGADMALGGAESRRLADRLGVPVRRWRLVGGLELAGAAGLLLGLAWPPVGIAAAGGLVALTIGALLTHVRAGDQWRAAVPATVCAAGAAASLVLLAAA